MKWLLLTIFLFSSVKNRSTKGLPSQHGTYLMAGICKEGILFFADSRTVILDTEGKIGAYYDNARKLFHFQNMVLGMAGRTTFSKINFPGIFNEFAKSHINQVPISEFITTFLAFSKSILIESDYKLLQGNQFMVCGYSNGSPYIYWHWNNQNEAFTKIGDYKSSSDKDNENKKGFSPIFQNFDTSKATNILGHSLLRLMDTLNKDTISPIGGNLAIATISRHSITILGPTENSFATKKEFIEAYKKNIIRIHYRSIYDSISYREALLNGAGN